MVVQKQHHDLFDLTGKVALVTGAAQNIGKTFAMSLASYGASIAIIDKDEEKAHQLKAVLLNLNCSAETFIADLANHDSIKMVMHAIIKKFGKIDIAFNNIGLCYGHPAEEIPAQAWQELIHMNLTTTFYCCQEEAHIMKKQGNGKIINTASIAGVLIPRPQKITAYNTGKAGVIQLTRSLAAEWAEYGICVNAISPGAVLTPSLDTHDMQPLIKQWCEQIPLKRLAHFADLEGIAVFLASRASSYITGHNFIIDGGYSLW